MSYFEDTTEKDEELVVLSYLTADCEICMGENDAQRPARVGSTLDFYLSKGYSDVTELHYKEDHFQYCLSVIVKDRTVRGERWNARTDHKVDYEMFTTISLKYPNRFKYGKFGL